MKVIELYDDLSLLKKASLRCVKFGVKLISLGLTDYHTACGQGPGSGTTWQNVT